MEIQQTLNKIDISLYKKVKRTPNKFALEEEKEDFIRNMCEFIDIIYPKSRYNNDFKAFLMMSYSGMSYRRAYSDFKKMYEEELLTNIPKRSTLNDFANNKETKNILSKLIQTSALLFMELEDTVIIDSSWFGLIMNIGGYKKSEDRRTINFKKTRKLHIACLKNSKIVAYAIVTKGTCHDSPLFKYLISGVKRNGFKVSRLIADAAYCSKDNYALCSRLGIKDAFIDFRSNASVLRSKSMLWRDKLRLLRDKPELWKDNYRYRAIVETVFSAIKRKNLNYLRSKNELAQDIELLAKSLVYNITVIGRYS